MNIRTFAGVNSEIVLFHALVRWAKRKCDDADYEPGLCSHKHILTKKLIFSVRYLLMNDDEFDNVVEKSGFLDETEIRILKACKCGSDASSSTSCYVTDAVLVSLAKQRNFQPYPPLPLSDRSRDAIAVHKRLVVFKRNDEERKARNAKRAQRNQNKPRNEDEARENRCVNFTLNCLATVFD